MIRSYNKYKAQRTSLDGYSFPSQLEAALYQLLKLQEKAGELSDIKCQRHIYLTKARILYIADFSALDNKLNEMVYYEAKGFSTAVWAIKLKLYRDYGPARLRIYKGSAKNLQFIEEIIPSSLETCA